MVCVLDQVFSFLFITRRACCSDHLYFLSLQVFCRFLPRRKNGENARSELRCKRGKPFPVPRAAKREKIKAKLGKKANCIFRTTKSLPAMAFHAWRPFEGPFPFSFSGRVAHFGPGFSVSLFSLEKISFFQGGSVNTIAKKMCKQYRLP